MDAALASWLDAGEYFDYLGFEVFFRMEGSGPGEMFGPKAKPTQHMMAVFNQILDYNDGRRVLHKVGRFIKAIVSAFCLS